MGSRGCPANHAVVIVVVDVDGPDTLDRLVIDLPIIKEHGHHIWLDIIPLRRYEDWAADLKKRVG